MKTSACCRLPLKACAMPPGTSTRRISFASSSTARRECRTTGQPELPGHLKLCRAEAFEPFRVEARHEAIEPDLADGHQPRIVTVGRQRVMQALQIVVCRARDCERMDAEGVAVAVFMGERPDGVEVADVDGRQHDLADAGLPGPGRRRPRGPAENSPASRWQWVVDPHPR
jgi:hypothetical protein